MDCGSTKFGLGAESSRLPACLIVLSIYMRAPSVSAIIVHMYLGYNELLIIPAGATTVTLRENDGSRSHLG